MINAFIIIGNASMRKSGAVRALTGAWDRGIYKIETNNNGIIDCFVQIRSLQEVNLSANDFISEIRENNISHTLLTLRFDNVEDYLKKFIKEHWKLKTIIAFIKNDMFELSYDCYPIYNTDEIPVNKISSIIRKIWDLE